MRAWKDTVRPRVGAIRRPTLLPLPRLATLVVAGSAWGCFPFDCESEWIEVRMDATVTRGGSSTSAELFDRFAPTNTTPDEYAAVKGVLVQDPAGRSTPVVWSLPAFETNGGYLAVALRAPLRPGDVLGVEEAFQGGGWGTTPLADRGEARVAARAEGFVATSAEGTVEVLEVSPLRLRLNLTLRDGEGATLRVEGTVDFRLVREDVTCT